MKELEPRELRAYFRKPQKKYLVAVDLTRVRHTINDLSKYCDYLDVNHPNWSTIDVYFRYGIDRYGNFHPARKCVVDSRDEIWHFEDDIDLEYKQIARYTNLFRPLSSDPRVKDVDNYLFKDDNAVKAWKEMMSGQMS